MVTLTRPQQEAVDLALQHPERRIAADVRVSRSLCDKQFAYSLWAQEGDHSYGFAGGFYLFDDISPEAVAERRAEAND